MKPTSALAALLCGLWISVAPAAYADAQKSAQPAKSKGKVHRPVFNGWLVPEARLRIKAAPRPSGNIIISSVNDPKAVISVNIYNADGSFNDDALEKLNHVWRCRRTEAEKQIDPHLFEVISHIYDKFKKPLTLVSGFRNQRRTTSFHYIGSASDVSIQGIPDSRLKEFVEGLDVGGMGIGIYPHAGFIHVDVRPEPS